MKKLFTVLAALFFTVGLFAQPPEKISYQAVIRDLKNNLVTNQAVGMKISILQGSISGTPVYVEIYNPNPTTNANGLVTVEIGGGFSMRGTFSKIDWSSGPYFLKIETDPTGGTNYTITGISQILSVPYALHAKTAESLTGGITETDPVFTAWDKNYNDLKNKPTIPAAADGSETKVTAGANITVTGTGTTASPYMVKTKTYSEGDFAHGGIVFWVDETGQHGLVCAKKDQSTGVRWYAGTFGYTRAKGDGPYAGKANTSIIIAAHVAIGDDGNTYAARICNELQITENGITYGDWYLPSMEELNLMYQNRAKINATAVLHGGSSLASAWYWSSTEFFSDKALIIGYPYGNPSSATKSNNTNIGVRAVRAF